MVVVKEPQGNARSRRILVFAASLIWSIITIVASIGLIFYAGFPAAPLFGEQPTADDLRTAALETFFAAGAWLIGFSILGVAHRSRRWFIVAIVGFIFIGVGALVYLDRSTTS